MCVQTPGMPLVASENSSPCQRSGLFRRRRHESAGESSRRGREERDRPKDVTVSVPEFVERVEVENGCRAKRHRKNVKSLRLGMRLHIRQDSRMKTEVPFAIGTAVIGLPSRVLVIGSESGRRSSLPAVRIVDGTGA